MLKYPGSKWQQQFRKQTQDVGRRKSASCADDRRIQSHDDLRAETSCLEIYKHCDAGVNKRYRINLSIVIGE